VPCIASGLKKNEVDVIWIKPNLESQRMEFYYGPIGATVKLDGASDTTTTVHSAPLVIPLSLSIVEFQCIVAGWSASCVCRVVHSFFKSCESSVP
jgi:hypothetical protein